MKRGYLDDELRDIYIPQPSVCLRDIWNSLMAQLSDLSHEAYAEFIKKLTTRRQEVMGTSEEDNPTIHANDVVITRERYDYLLNCELCYHLKEEKGGDD